MENQTILSMRKCVIAVFYASIIVMMLSSQGISATYVLGDNSLAVSGYINQGVQFGIAGDRYDTRDGFQAAVTQALLEFKYESRGFTAFVSGNLDMDWAYIIYDGDDEWEQKNFDESKDDLFILDESYTLLKEAHVTFGAGPLVFRIGKQIIAWGEMDGQRVMDQINPTDARRGISDVEFETTIIPIWLVKADYFPSTLPSALQDLALELVYNPNAQFISNFSGDPANQVGGIWAYNIALGPGMRMGTTHSSSIIEEPDNWDSDGQEFGVRVKMLTNSGTFITLNYFDGVANEKAVVVRNLIPAPPEYQGPTGNIVLDPVLEGKFPDQRYAGLTLSRDLTLIRFSALGGVAPLLRLEALYGFDSTYGTSGLDPANPFGEELQEHDETKLGIGIDWKVRIPFINDKDSISISPQFIWHHIFDYPDTYKLAQSVLTFEEDNYFASMMLRTTYLHNKLTPVIFYMRNFYGSNKWDIFVNSITYAPNSTWSFKLSNTIVRGDMVGEYLGNKDNIGFTVSYNF